MHRLYNIPWSVINNKPPKATVLWSCHSTLGRLSPRRSEVHSLVSPIVNLNPYLSGFSLQKYDQKWGQTVNGFGNSVMKTSQEGCNQKMRSHFHTGDKICLTFLSFLFGLFSVCEYRNLLILFLPLNIAPGYMKKKGSWDANWAFMFGTVTDVNL